VYYRFGNFYKKVAKFVFSPVLLIITIFSFFFFGKSQIIANYFIYINIHCSWLQPTDKENSINIHYSWLQPTYIKNIHKKMRNYILIIAFLFCIKLQAQDSIRISGQLQNNTKFVKVFVKKYNIGSVDIAAIPIKKDGSFSIAAPNELHAGVYRFQYSQISLSEYVDVILDGKEREIHFTLDVAEAIENRTPVFTKSIENSNWYAYHNQSKVILQKIDALEQVLVRYPKNKDKIVKQVERAIAQEQKNYKTQVNKFLQQNTNTWAATMVQNTPHYFTNAKEDWRLQDFERREHYWDNIDTTNPILINTPLFTEHILKYLQYYMNPEMQFSETEMVEGFKKSVDTIMQKFSGNEETKKFALQYLQLGFKEIGQEKVLQYIDEKYQNEIKQCQDDTQKAAFENRMAGYAAMKEGNQAPDITLTNNQTLYDIKSEQTLVVFWASWCPHCIEEMPKLNQWAKENPNTKVVAISIDEDKVAYETAIKAFPNITHNCDFKKWQGKAVSDYYVYGTPTFILLDRDKKILGKVTSFEQLISLVN
jgi:thiol-disulfide isomerase/thioredoxin